VEGSIDSPPLAASDDPRSYPITVGNWVIPNNIAYVAQIPVSPLHLVQRSACFRIEQDTHEQCLVDRKWHNPKQHPLRPPSRLCSLLFSPPCLSPHSRFRSDAAWRSDSSRGRWSHSEWRAETTADFCTCTVFSGKYLGSRRYFQCSRRACWSSHARAWDQSFA